MRDLEQANFFTDAALCNDPYPFFEFVRSNGPVYVEPFYGVAVVTGPQEALTVFNDSTNAFSACNAATGPLPPLPFVPAGDDISPQIARHRGEMPCADLLVTYDQPEHPLARSLLMSLFTPRRLKENEDYLRRLVDSMVDDLLTRRSAEVVNELGSPYATLVITDLLGVPEQDRDTFRDRLVAVPAPIGGEVNEDSYKQHPLEFLHERFTAYIEERRIAAREDVLTLLAAAKYPDGTTPSVLEVVRVAVNLYAAGQETTARLLATTLRMLAEQPSVQTLLRKEPHRVPDFVEEALRLEGPIKGIFRLVRKTTRIGDVSVKAGTTVMVAIPSLNQDPARWERPTEVRIDRPRLREHFAFGRGKHTCPGAALARVEVRVMLEQLLKRTSNIAISDLHHGPQGARRFEYAPTYLIRGLNALHLTFEPATASA